MDLVQQKVLRNSCTVPYLFLQILTVIFICCFSFLVSKSQFLVNFFTAQAASSNNCKIKKKILIMIIGDNFFNKWNEKVVILCQFQVILHQTKFVSKQILDIILYYSTGDLVWFILLQTVELTTSFAALLILNIYGLGRHVLPGPIICIYIIYYAK